MLLLILSQSVHIFHEGAVAGVGAHGIDALVGMAQVDALEMVAEPRQLSQTAIADGPVGEHVGNRGEDVEPGTSCGVGVEEVGAVAFVDAPPGLLDEGLFALSFVEEVLLCGL